MFKKRAGRLVLAATIVLAALGWAAGQASASRGLAITNGVALWFAQGQVTVALNGGVNVVCTWRLGMNPQPPIAKTPLATIAAVQPTGAGGSSITNCNFTPMTGIILNGIVIGYLNFTGTLPNITSILARANNFRFQYSIPALGLNCLWAGPLNFVFTRNVATGQITAVTISGTLLQTPPCPTPATVNGTLNIQLPVAPVVQLV